MKNLILMLFMLSLGVGMMGCDEPNDEVNEVITMEKVKEFPVSARMLMNPERFQLDSNEESTSSLGEGSLTCTFANSGSIFEVWNIERLIGPCEGGYRADFRIEWFQCQQGFSESIWIEYITLCYQIDSEDDWDEGPIEF